MVGPPSSRRSSTSTEIGGYPDSYIEEKIVFPDKPVLAVSTRNGSQPDYSSFGYTAPPAPPGYFEDLSSQVASDLIKIPKAVIEDKTKAPPKYSQVDQSFIRIPKGIIDAETTRKLNNYFNADYEYSIISLPNGKKLLDSNEFLKISLSSRSDKSFYFPIPEDRIIETEILPTFISENFIMEYIGISKEIPPQRPIPPTLDRRDVSRDLVPPTLDRRDLVPPTLDRRDVSRDTSKGVTFDPDVIKKDNQKKTDKILKEAVKVLGKRKVDNPEDILPSIRAPSRN